MGGCEVIIAQDLLPLLRWLISTASSGCCVLAVLPSLQIATVGTWRVA